MASTNIIVTRLDLGVMKLGILAETIIIIPTKASQFTLRLPATSTRGVTIVLKT